MSAVELLSSLLSGPQHSSATIASCTEPSWHRKDRRRRQKARAALSDSSAFALPPARFTEVVQTLNRHHASFRQYDRHMAWYKNQYGYKNGNKGRRYNSGRNYSGRFRPYEVCECGMWVFKDRKKEYCSGCGRKTGDHPAASPDSPAPGGALNPKEVAQAAALAAALRANPELAFLAARLEAAGLPTKVPEAAQPAKPLSLNVRTKQSLAKTKEAHDQVYRCEQKYIKKKEHIEKIQAQLDKANEELAEIQTDLESKKKVAADEDEKHQTLVQSSPETPEDTADVQFLLASLPGGTDPRVSSNPQAVALARSFSQGLASITAKLGQAESVEAADDTGYPDWQEE